MLNYYNLQIKYFREVLKHKSMSCTKTWMVWVVRSRAMIYKRSFEWTAEKTEPCTTFSYYISLEPTYFKNARDVKKKPWWPRGLTYSLSSKGSWVQTLTYTSEFFQVHVHNNIWNLPLFRVKNIVQQGNLD